MHTGHTAMKLRSNISQLGNEARLKIMAEVIAALAPADRLENMVMRVLSCGVMGSSAHLSLKATLK